MEAPVILRPTRTFCQRPGPERTTWIDAMPHGVVREIIPAPAADVFRLIHDYDRRLKWDTLLQRAYMVDGRAPGLGAIAVCKGKSHLGGIELQTEYVTFVPPRVAAVRMVNRPPFFESWAATIRHEPLSDSSSALEYKFHFRARPGWLRWVLHPLMNAAFRWETRRRLRALKRFLGSASDTASRTPAENP